MWEPGHILRGMVYPGQERIFNRVNRYSNVTLLNEPHMYVYGLWKKGRTPGEKITNAEQEFLVYGKSANNFNYVFFGHKKNSKVITKCMLHDCRCLCGKPKILYKAFCARVNQENVKYKALGNYWNKEEPIILF